MNLKTLLIALLAELIYLIFIIYGMFEGFIDVGMGLGGLFFLYLSIGSAVLLLILTIIASRLKNKTYAKWVAFLSFVVFLLFCLFITYVFTLGRGHYCPWNGQIFRPCH